MADLSLPVSPLPAKSMAAPVSYNLVFEISSMLSQASVQHLDIYLIEESLAELICACPIPALQFEDSIFSTIQIDEYIYPALEIVASFASADCEEC